MKKLLSLEEMQELLTDYAFNKLSPNEEHIFEENLKNFPELENEIIEIKSVFSKVNKEVIRENLQNKTANLTYRIRLKQYELNKNKTARKNILKFAFPFIIVIAFYFILRQIQFGESQVENNKSQEVLLSNIDADIIFGDSSEISFYDPYQNSFYYYSPNVSDEYEYIDFIRNSTNQTVFNYMNEITEKEFNQLLNEMDDEKFSL